MTRGLHDPAQLPMYVRSNKQAEGWLRIYPSPILSPLAHTLGPNLLLTAREPVKLMDRLLRMGQAGLAFLGRSPHLTAR